MKKVIKVPPEAPEIIIRFCNFLWVNIPKDWGFNYLYQKNILYIVVLTAGGAIIKRQYTYKSIQTREKDILGLASDCAEEIINDAKKLAE